MQEDYSAFFERLGDIATERALSMKTLTSFRIGGAANVLFPTCKEQLLKIMEAARAFGICPFILGNGTNLLVGDSGIEEPVICLQRYCGELRQEGALFSADAGMLLSSLARETVKRGFSGLEWANGIPGSLGGAIAMNAGAYGGEIAEVIEAVTYFENGEIFTVSPEKDDFGYRKSPFCAPERIILGASLRLQEDKDGSAALHMQDFAQRRISKQPLKYPSAGSVFKRPEGYFAGALIEQAGLKGMRVGGAQVSELHAGFIINTGDASCKDVLKLIHLIQARVYENSGIMLQCEIKMIGMEDAQ